MKKIEIYKNCNGLSIWQSADIHAFDFLGSHRTESGWVFRVWAPNAKEVSVTGDFCGWDINSHPMKRISDNGIWETEIKGLLSQSLYKYVIKTHDGRRLYKSDMYANFFELRPNTASRLFDISEFNWHDAQWLEKRKVRDKYNSPMNIYEMHMGSWRLKDDGTYYTYAELADRLLDYVCDMGYTHIEVMPLSEYPYDKSWGYQVTGYFAVTSRYGTPFDFMKFVDKCHARGIGVIMDWVPAHFPKDESGLFEYDGECLYEYSDPLKREHPDWGTRIFDYGKREVVSFLISSAINWLENYHIDGIRVDAVASMLYLDYGKKDGDWRPNIHGGNGNLEAVEFLKLFNTAVHAEYPGVMTIAEESTAWPLVTHPVQNGGLGFDFKWNMGWMNDTLRYMSKTHDERRGMQNMMSFSTTYAFSENFILPLSHDEVVHGKCSLIEKMPGYYHDKFANLKAYIGYMMTHPGKKLCFMGGEFAHFTEWSEERGLDWELFNFPAHRQFNEYIKDINRLYKKNPCLYECDTGYNGFCWISADDCNNSVYAYRRIAKDGAELITVLNFSPHTHENYRLGLPRRGIYTLALSSDSEKYGGQNREKEKVSTQNKPMHGLKYSAQFTLPAFSAVIYKKRRPGPRRSRSEK